MFKKSQFSVDFGFDGKDNQDLEVDENVLPNVPIDLLPCRYPNDVAECNRDVFFDPCIRQSEQHPQLKEVTLQGRKMVGRDLDLTEAGYTGRVLGIKDDSIDPATMQRKI